MEEKINVEENDVLNQFVKLLGQQGMGEQGKDFLELFRYVAAMQIQLTVITSELQGVREQLSQLQGINWMDSIGSEMKQIGNSVSNMGRLLSGKDAKEIQGENPSVGLTRAINKMLKNIMAGLQKNVNSIGRALDKLDRFSSRLEARVSVTDKLLQTKSTAAQNKETPVQVKNKEMCM